MMAKKSIPVYPILLLLSSLAVFDCTKKAENDSPKQIDSPKTNESPKQSESPKMSDLPVKFKLYNKYTGMIDGKYPITMLLTLKGSERGIWATGEYYYDKYGACLNVYGRSLDSNKFYFKVNDERSDSETFVGKYSSFEKFEGIWTKFSYDTVYDAKTYESKKTQTIKAYPFTISRTTLGITPVSFEFFDRDDDSTGNRDKKLKGDSTAIDTIFSSLGITTVKINSGNKPIDSSINQAIARSLLTFVNIPDGERFSILSSGNGITMDDFDRIWKVYKVGNGASADFYCDIEANENDVLSVNYSGYLYAGGAHGSSYDTSASYDLLTGKNIELEDILIPNYDAELGGMAGNPSCDSDRDEDVICSIGGMLKYGFTIKHDGIDLYADPQFYTRIVHIPYSQLAPIVKKQGVLAKFLKPDELRQAK